MLFGIFLHHFDKHLNLVKHSPYRTKRKMEIYSKASREAFIEYCKQKLNDLPYIPFCVPNKVFLQYYIKLFRRKP